ncbi:hypothetical protein HY250_03135 [Candidatus Azambacteria bacterium]|nr:hypothetical protein [Candidatus Azambacteria bacterium]MBI3685371.1 hypothetical protein [Candidatus Azambacteria bacterium]
MFFLFLVDPAYLSFSGFLLFYLSVFAWVWSFFLLGGHFLLGGRKKRSLGGAFARRTALLALLVATSIFLSHTNLFSLYAFIALLALVIFAEYMFMRR